MMRTACLKQSMELPAGSTSSYLNLARVDPTTPPLHEPEAARAARSSLRSGARRASPLRQRPPRFRARLRRAPQLRRACAWHFSIAI